MKTYTSFAIVVAFALTFTSCKKQDDVTVTKEIQVSLSANQSYQAEVPAAGDADDVMQTTAQPQHSSTYSLSTDASGKSTLQYTPALDYTGTDELRISNSEGQHHGSGGHHCGGSHHHHDNTTVFVYKFTITGSNK